MRVSDALAAKRPLTCCALARQMRSVQWPSRWIGGRSRRKRTLRLPSSKLSLVKIKGDLETIGVPPTGDGGIMEAFLIVGTIAGILVGLRFKVFALFPVILLVAGVIIVTGHGLKVTTLTVLSTVALLQMGYLVGCAVRAYFGTYTPASVQPTDSLSDPRNSP